MFGFFAKINFFGHKKDCSRRYQGLKFCTFATRFCFSMKKIPSLIISLVLAVLLAGCTGHGNLQREPQPSDTLYTPEAAMQVYGYDPERALVIIDSALIVGNIDEDLAQLLRAKVYSQSLVEVQLDTAQQILLDLLESNYTKDLDNREIVLDLLFNIARNKHQVERMLYWATQKADCCRELGHETEALRTEAEIGFLLTELGEEEKGLAKLNGVIANLAGQRHIDEMDACIIALKRKITVLNQLGREEEIIPIATRIIEIVDDCLQHYDQYTDNSYRMPKSETQIDKYCDFYTAQAQGFIATAYAKLGEMDSARRYVDIFEQSDFGKTFGGRRMMTSVWCNLGEYDKMLAAYDEMVMRMGDDTLNVEYVEMLSGRALAAEAFGNPIASIDYWRRYAEMSRLVNKQLQESQAYEYAARYHLQEERMNTEREQAQAQNNRNLAIAGFILALIAVVFIVWLLIQRSAINRKNRVLVEQIAEAVKYKGLAEKEERKTIVPHTELSDEELFKQLSEVIRHERLFTNPNFGRQMLIDRFHLTERRIGSVFSYGGSLPDFIRELRLENACRLLSDHPEMSISDIAIASGFSSLSVFSREFKRKLEVTPTYYREHFV